MCSPLCMPLRLLIKQWRQHLGMTESVPLQEQLTVSPQQGKTCTEFSAIDVVEQFLNEVRGRLLKLLMKTEVSKQMQEEFSYFLKICRKQNEVLFLWQSIRTKWGQDTLHNSKLLLPSSHSCMHPGDCVFVFVESAWLTVAQMQITISRQIHLQRNHGRECNFEAALKQFFEVKCICDVLCTCVQINRVLPLLCVRRDLKAWISNFEDSCSMERTFNTWKNK